MKPITITPHNNKYRPLHIAVITGIGANLLFYPMNTASSAIIITMIMTTAYMVTSLFVRTEGKHPCKLHNIQSGRQITITAGGKQVPIYIYGIDAPEPDQKGFEKTKTWLTKALSQKNLTVEDVEPDYFPNSPLLKGGKPAKIFADGKDIALQGLQAGAFFIAAEYKVPEHYKTAEAKAEQKSKGIHATLDTKPNIFRANRKAQKAAAKQRLMDTGEGAEAW